MDANRIPIDSGARESLLTGVRNLSAAVKAQVPLRGRALEVHVITLPSSAIGESEGAGEIGPPLKLKSEIGASRRRPDYGFRDVDLTPPADATAL